MIVLEKTFTLADIISDQINKHFPEHDFYFPIENSTKTNIKAVRIRPNGLITVFNSCLARSEIAIGNISRFTRLTIEERLQLLNNTIQELDQDIVQTSCSDKILVKSTCIEGKVKFFDSLSGKLIKSLSLGQIDQELEKIDYRNVLLQTSLQDIDPGTDQILDILEKVLEDNGPIINYEYLEKNQVLLVRKGKSSNTKQVTFMQSKLSMMPKLRVFHHIHFRAKNNDIKKCFGILENAANVVLQEENNNLGTINLAWDGYYGAYLNNINNAKEQEACLIDAKNFEEYMEMQGAYINSFWKACNFAHDQKFDLSEKGYLRARFTHAFEKKQYNYSIKSSDFTRKLLTKFASM